ncbi:shikimate dehydrogenase family protein [Mycetocola zhadangensis]|uniref:Shikimate dehydrogenase n=1 Tax=Mycetocola zhadangensis TaxID=1164595 RepID=A0A3L7J9H2_9MICO|nr:shikimate dehydrogenase [Mycetocola zhadangensis]RLQ86111.1 shikimate dehydrogenase [Mycetocola zhadangensis]GGE88475.1 shikimate 5-dehydrogenase [Mycetocola zhadangensis]
MTDRLAVLGSPIGHSKSPVLHRTAYEMLDLDWEYSSREVIAPELAAIVTGLDASWRGLSLTMPLKGAAFDLAGTRDTMALLTGAVNTLRVVGSGPTRALFGFNTDVVGITRALAAVGVNQATHVHILGNGSTAASAVVAAAELGALSVSVFARSPQKSAALIDLGRRAGLTVTLDTFSVAPDRPEPELVISTLPGGAIAPIAYPTGVRSRSALLDVAYDPWPSRLALDWTDAGGTVANGLSMLVHQALVQVRIFVSNDPFSALPNEEMVLSAMLASVGLDQNGVPHTR